jgi:hypothetical protein
MPKQRGRQTIWDFGIRNSDCVDFGFRIADWFDCGFRIADFGFAGARFATGPGTQHHSNPNLESRAPQNPQSEVPIPRSNQSEIRIPKSKGYCSFWRSQARAICQSRRTVAREMPRKSAVSSSVIPPKYFSSTILA